MILNERDTPDGLLVAVCDRAVLGETFEDGSTSLTVEEEFYAGEEASPDEVLDSLSGAHVANLVGTESVGLAVEHGFVDEATVLDIGETRHAQVLWLD